MEKPLRLSIRMWERRSKRGIVVRSYWLTEEEFEIKQKQGFPSFTQAYRKVGKRMKKIF